MTQEARKVVGWWSAVWCAGWWVMGALENNISQHNTLCTIHYTREQSRANEYHSSCYDAFVLDKTLKLFLTQPVPAPPHTPHVEDLQGCDTARHRTSAPSCRLLTASGQFLIINRGDTGLTDDRPGPSGEINISSPALSQHLHCPAST